MKCIYCLGPLEVINSRAQTTKNQVWRRRRCQNCGAVFTSHEAIDLAAALKVQNGRHSTPFERDKLFLSIYNTCRHRPSAASDAKALTETALKKIITTSANGTIDRVALIKIVKEILRRFDKAAEVQYTAFHKTK